MAGTIISNQKRAKRSGGFFAAVGAASGLSNALRFPALCAEYSGAFFIAYICALILFCFPLLCAELSALSGKKFPQILLRAASLNSLLIALYYVTVSAKLGTAGISYAISGKVGGVGVWATISVLALLAFFAYTILKRRALNLSGKLSLACFFTIFTVLASFGVAHIVRGGALPAFNLTALQSAKIWIDALGQSMLSLSLAAGVMPALGAGLKTRRGVLAQAAGITAANLAGCTLAFFSTLPFVAQFSGGGLSVAFGVYPQVISALCKSKSIASFVGLTIYLALAAVALHSTCSLAFPATEWLGDSAPLIFVVTAAALTPVFAADDCLVLNIIDKVLCNGVAPVLALCEIACLAPTLAKYTSQ